MDTQRPKKAKFLFWLAMLFAVICFYKGCLEDRKIKDNHIVVCGSIISTYYSKGPYIKIEFMAGNNKIEDDKSCSVETKNMFDKDGKSKILVAFQKGNPTNNVVLENSNDFTNFSIKKQDTLGVICK